MTDDMLHFEDSDSVWCVPYKAICTRNEVELRVVRDSIQTSVYLTKKAIENLYNLIQEMDSDRQRK